MGVIFPFRVIYNLRNVTLPVIRVKRKRKRAKRLYIYMYERRISFFALGGREGLDFRVGSHKTYITQHSV